MRARCALHYQRFSRNYSLDFFISRLVALISFCSSSIRSFSCSWVGSISLIRILLIGDKGRLKALIKDYLSENSGTSRLAYLLYALRQSEHIESCNYITFHRALQQLVSKPIGGPDVPQRRYHELLADPKLLGSKGKKWQQAKAIIDRWTVLFGKKDIYR